MIGSALHVLRDLLPPSAESSVSVWSLLGVTNIREALTLITGVAATYAIAAGLFKKKLRPAIAEALW